MREIQAEEKEKKRADEIQMDLMLMIEAGKELTLEEMELMAQGQTSTSAVVDPPPQNRYPKSPKLPVFIDEKDVLDNLLCFECYAENANWEKNM